MQSQLCESMFRMLRFQNFETCILQALDNQHSHRGFVFDNQN